MEITDLRPIILPPSISQRWRQNYRCCCCCPGNRYISRLLLSCAQWCCCISMSNDVFSFLFKKSAFFSSPVSHFPRTLSLMQQKQQQCNIYQYGSSAFYLLTKGFRAEPDGIDCDWTFSFLLLLLLLLLLLPFFSLSAVVVVVVFIAFSLSAPSSARVHPLLSETLRSK